jgi:predicted alpha/beta superfamily hydrolase
MQDSIRSLRLSESIGGIDEAMRDLIEAGRARGAIVVGIWNTPQRSQEYMPQRPIELFRSRLAWRRPPLSDRYLKFLVRELKPFIDEHYRTLPEWENTFTMGSSMGGLISIYAVCEYPDRFGGAGCISTHWPATGGVVVDYLASALPEAAKHRLYFDYGTATVDALYEPYQKRVDQKPQEENCLATQRSTPTTGTLEGVSAAVAAIRARFGYQAIGLDYGGIRHSARAPR